MNSQFLSTFLAAAAKRPYKRRVSYLESTGTQWIDTGVESNLETTIYFSGHWTDNTINYQFVMGARNDAVAGATFQFLGLAKGWNPPVIYQTYQGEFSTGFGLAEALVYHDWVSTLEYGNQQVWMDGTPGEKHTNRYPISSFGGVTWYVFARNQSGVANNFAKMRIYRLRIERNGVVQRNFIPVIDWNDRPCMYDRVSRQLFYNQGTGEFIVDWRDEELFTLDLNITDDDLGFGIQPFWDTGGFCHVLDWGDGTYTAATNSGAQLIHTYAAAGSYKIKARGSVYRLRIGSTNPTALIDCNGNWDALGDITNGQDMFSGCTDALLTFTSLPAGLTNGQSMFNNCISALLPFDVLPDGLTNGYGMFFRCYNAPLAFSELPTWLVDGRNMFAFCYNAILPIKKLPTGLTGNQAMFNRCTCAELDLHELPPNITSVQDMFHACERAVISLTDIANNSTQGWPGLTTLYYFLNGAGTYSSPGTVTGHIATFMRKLPNVNTMALPFTNTATTIFSNNDYFELTLRTTVANQVWGFTATSDKGRWFCYDWGEGEAGSRGLTTFTSGTKVTHTFATPRTYRIKLATAPCNIVFDAYDSDNGNYWALGWEDNETFDIDIDLGLTPGNLQFGVQPYLNTGGECFIDWGDGSIQRISSNGAQTHTYAAEGKYTVKVRGNMYQFRVGSTNPAAVTDANGNWEVLGNITSGREMFRDCVNAALAFTEIPENITDGWAMFYGCSAATLPLMSLPSGLQEGYYMFAQCAEAELPLGALPDTLVSVSYMFSDCSAASLPLRTLPEMITSAGYMFSGCKSALLPLAVLPSGLLSASNMFAGCENAELPLTRLPDNLSNLNLAFRNCYKARLKLVNLPHTLSDVYGAFSHCENAEFSLDAWIAGASGMWDGIMNLGYWMQYAGSYNNPGTVTGHIATFMHSCPNVTQVDGAFVYTNTTTFGSADYLEITLTTTEANQSWGFTATSSAGRWYCFDWGDGTAVTSNKNLAVFTNGTRIQHTFKNPGTYHIKLAMNADVLDTDAYDSDNGAYGMLTNDSIVFNGALYNGSMDFIEYTAQDLSILMGNDITYTDGTILIN